MPKRTLLVLLVLAATVSGCINANNIGMRDVDRAWTLLTVSFGVAAVAAGAAIIPPSADRRMTAGVMAVVFLVFSLFIFW